MPGAASVAAGRGGARAGGADQPVELADFAPFEIAAEAYDADVARLEPFNR
jgi:hypothetical protein